MAGLMPSGPAATPAPPPAEDPAAMAPDPAAAGGEEASPEEQALYEEIVSRGFMLLYDKNEGIRPAIRKMLEANPEDPGAALGEAAGLIISRVEDLAADAGMEIPPEVREAAAAEIFENVAEAASAAGIHDFEADDAAFERGFLIAADTMRQQATASGRLDPEAAKADLVELAQADEDGRLDAIMQSLGGEA